MCNHSILPDDPDMSTRIEDWTAQGWSHTAAGELAAIHGNIKQPAPRDEHADVYGALRSAVRGVDKRIAALAALELVSQLLAGDVAASPAADLALDALIELEARE